MKFSNKKLNIKIKNIINMTLGIAIPTFKGHSHHLKQLLDSISLSTVLPSQVSISISSMDIELTVEDYPFEIIITKTNKKRNVCENRNIAASKLNTDIISFIDGDDIPHIKRNEYIIQSFEMGANVLVHNYYINSDTTSDWYKGNLERLEYFNDYVDTVFVNNTFAMNSQNHQDYHCAHISLKKEIFEKFKYDESIGWESGEDGEYTRRLVGNGILISYVSNKLSQYVH